MALNKLECLLGLSSKDKQQIKLQKENLNKKKKKPCLPPDGSKYFCHGH